MISDVTTLREALRMDFDLACVDLAALRRGPAVKDAFARSDAVVDVRARIDAALDMYLEADVGAHIQAPGDEPGAARGSDFTRR
jgi:hypothetical protein